MLGFTLLHRDASKIELLHIRTGATFTFPLCDQKLSDQYLIAPDLSDDFRGDPINLDDCAAVEGLAALARMAAGLHLPTGHLESAAPLGRLSRHDRRV
jgi:hypothetical protein